MTFNNVADSATDDDRLEVCDLTISQPRAEDRFLPERADQKIAKSFGSDCCCWYTLISLRPQESASGEALFAEKCTGCHPSTPETGSRIGPSLAGILGRRIASLPDYTDYSTCLRRIGGVWSELELDAFVKKPRAICPGTAMDFDGVANDAERAAIVQYLARAPKQFRVIHDGSFAAPTELTTSLIGPRRSSGATGSRCISSPPHRTPVRNWGSMWGRPAAPACRPPDIAPPFRTSSPAHARELKRAWLYRFQ